MSSKTCPLVRVLAATLLVGGCYSGLDDDSAGLLTLTGGPATQGGSQASASAGEETSAAEGTMGAGETTSASEPSGTTGAVDGSTGDATTNAPGTTGGDSGDGTTGGSSDSQTSGGSGDGTTGEPPPPPPPDPDVPDGVPYCDPAKNWQAGWRQLEEDVLVIVNQKRAQGANCGSEGNFGPAPPLTMDPALRCAARLHSKDMADRNFFNHTNPDGESPWDRMGKAGYGQYTNAGENIAAGSPTAAGTMDQWMGSDGHCANIMNPDFEHIGVGYYPGGQYGHLWTQVFGAK